MLARVNQLKITIIIAAIFQVIKCYSLFHKISLKDSVPVQWQPLSYHHGGINQGHHPEYLKDRADDGVAVDVVHMTTGAPEINAEDVGTWGPIFLGRKASQRVMKYIQRTMDFNKTGVRDFCFRP